MSPDGNFLYYLKAAGSLWRVRIDGGDDREILSAVYTNSFAVVTRGIYFIPDGPDPAWSIDFLNFETGKINRGLTLPHLPQWGFDVSPDGREVLYTQTDGLDADLLLIRTIAKLRQILLRTEILSLFCSLVLEQSGLAMA